MSVLHSLILMMIWNLSTNRPILQNKREENPNYHNNI